MKKLVAQMEHIATQSQSDQIDYEIYVEVYHEWLKLMKHLGKCVSMGYADLTHKAKCMKENRILHCE